MKEKNQIAGVAIIIGIVVYYILQILRYGNEDLIALWPIFLAITLLVIIGLLFRYVGKSNPSRNVKVGEKDPSKGIFSNPNEPTKSKTSHEKKKIKKTRRNSVASRYDYSHRCPNCKTLINSGQSVCPECGTIQKSTIKCSYCGHENDKSNVMCEKCNNFLY